MARAITVMAVSGVVQPHVARRPAPRPVDVEHVVGRPLVSPSLVHDREADPEPAAVVEGPTRLLKADRFVHVDESSPLVRQLTREGLPRRSIGLDGSMHLRSHRSTRRGGVILRRKQEHDIDPITAPPLERSTSPSQKVRTRAMHTDKVFKYCVVPNTVVHPAGVAPNEQLATWRYPYPVVRPPYHPWGSVREFKPEIAYIPAQPGECAMVALTRHAVRYGESCSVGLVTCCSLWQVAATGTTSTGESRAGFAWSEWCDGEKY